jgi:hypothetical protein
MLTSLIFIATLSSKVINCLNKSQASTGTCGKRKDAESENCAMEKKKKTNRVKASVKGRKPIGLLESSVRKRETVASRGREFSHFFPFQQPAPLRRGES